MIERWKSKVLVRPQIIDLKPPQNMVYEKSEENSSAEVDGYNLSQSGSNDEKS